MTFYLRRAGTRCAGALTVFLLLATGLMACGASDSAPSKQERETVAVEKLLDRERAAFREGREAGREGTDAARQARESCMTQVCVEAGETLIEASNREVNGITRRVHQIQREVNSYSRGAVEAAYAAKGSPPR